MTTANAVTDSSGNQAWDGSEFKIMEMGESSFDVWKLSSGGHSDMILADLINSDRWSILYHWAVRDGAALNALVHISKNPSVNEMVVPSIGKKYRRYRRSAIYERGL